MNRPNPSPRPPGAPVTPPSLADYLVHYDLGQLLHEAKLDYGSVSSGAPRLMSQKEIAARFRRPGAGTLRRQTRPPHDHP